MNEILSVKEIIKLLQQNINNDVESRLKLVNKQIELRMIEVNELTNIQEVFLTLLENS